MELRLESLLYLLVQCNVVCFRVLLEPYLSELLQTGLRVEVLQELLVVLQNFIRIQDCDGYRSLVESLLQVLFLEVDAFRDVEELSSLFVGPVDNLHLDIHRKQEGSGDS